MPRVQVYLPNDLHDELKKRGLPASELLQIALRAELERQDALDETSRYLDALVAEVGEPSTRQQSQADAIAQRIRDRSLDRVSRTCSFSTAEGSLASPHAPRPRSR
jgi:hypothetical protein